MLADSLEDIRPPAGDSLGMERFDEFEDWCYHLLDLELPSHVDELPEEQPTDTPGSPTSP